MLKVNALSGFGVGLEPWVVDYTTSSSRFLTLSDKIQAGDLLVGMTFATRTATMTFTVPDGSWSHLGVTQTNHPSSSRYSRTSYYYKVADGSEAGASIDTASSAPDNYTNIVMVIRGLNGRTPSFTSSDLGANSDPAAVSLVPSSAQNLCFGYATVNYSAALSSYSVSPTPVLDINYGANLNSRFFYIGRNLSGTVSVDTADNGDANAHAVFYCTF